MNSSASMGEHPYFPLGVAMPGYAANTMTASVLVACFAAGSGAILATAYAIFSKVRPGMGGKDTFAALWFVLCGCIHLFFEGYFAYNYDRMPQQLDLFGQLWKEYSLSDSRYLTVDAFVVTMEAVTAIFWGPLSFVCAYCIVTGSAWRHPLQLIISLGQLYGDVLYYATSIFGMVVQDVEFCRPEAFYFYMYYGLCNAFWIVIPLFLMSGSVCAMKSAFEKVKALEGSKKGQ